MHTMKRTSKLALFFFLLFYATNVHSQVKTDFGEIGSYNVFVINSAALTSSDAQGKIAIGNKADISNGFSIGDQLALQNPPENILIAGDTLIYNGGIVYNGNVVYGEYADITSLDIPDGELFQGNPLDFSDLALQAAGIARQWKSIASNGEVDFTANKLTLSGNDPNLNVFSVDGSDLNAANNMEIITPSGATVLVNINGDSISWSGGLSLQGGNQTKVVYNFYEAGKLNLSGIEVKGSILAPFAAVNFISGVIYGNTIAYNLTGSGQYNNSLFTGEVNYTLSEIGSNCEVTIKQILTGKSFQISPPFLGHSSLWAGTFLGYVNNHSTTFYCIDLGNWLRFNKPYSFDKVISGKINYIVNNYYPNVPYTGTNGQLSNEREEAAAIQAAVWHFSDGFNPSHITGNNRIKQRAFDIIADAEDKNTSSQVTFEIRPANIMLTDGATATFTVFMKDADGNPVTNAEVYLSTDGGMITPESGETDASGAFVFTVKQADNEESITVTAESFKAVLPPASRYKYPDAQTLVTNYPVVTCLTATAKVYWTDEPLPGSVYSFYAYTSQNSDIPSNFFTDAFADEDKVYATFNSNGFGIFDKATESWKFYNTGNVDKFTTNSFSRVFKFESGDFKGDWVLGTQGHGFYYYDASDESYAQYDPTTTLGAFTGSNINAFAYYKKGGKEYLLIAHDAGLTKYNLTDDLFINYSISNSDFPGGNTRDVLVDSDGGIWAGTDYGLAYSTDEGANWTVYNKGNSAMTGDIITALAVNTTQIYVGTWNSGLYSYNITNGEWKNLSPFISAQPVIALLYKDDKLFVGNYDHGMYVYDGENFVQYPSVNHKGSPDIINSISFDGSDLWFATQSGLGRTTNGIGASSGNAAVTIEDKTIHIGGTTTLAVELNPTGDIEFYRLNGTIVYNQNEIEFKGKSYGELLSGWTVYYKTDTPGRLTFRALGSEPITEEGVLFYISFKIKESLSGGGLSAIYSTSFNSGVNSELNHSDLGIITFTNSGTENGGKGDANLDGDVDIADLIAISNHLTYGGDYELTGDAADNADTDDDDNIDTEDQSDLLTYLQTGVFPSHEEDEEDDGDVDSDDLDFDDEDGDDDHEDDGSVIVPINLDNALNVSSVQVTVNYQPDQINLASFSSQQLSNGNFVDAVEPEPGKTILNFAAPSKTDGSFNLGKLVFNLGNNALGNSIISLYYSINAGPQQTAPTILLTSNGDKSEIIPNKFELAQNYPNPFNPTTKIIFSIPATRLTARQDFASTTKVTLTVYDVLGRKITTLVNELKSPGVYEVIFNAENLASGVYFYKLHSGSFNLVKKMILLK